MGGGAVTMAEGAKVLLDAVEVSDHQQGMEMDSMFGQGRLTAFRAAAQGEVAGMHDGSRATLVMGALDDDVVFHHEYGHEILFTRTLDGALLALLWSAIDRSPRAGSGRLRALHVTADALVSASRFAQEVFATYYGIKAVNPAMGINALGMLPKEYRDYFDVAAGAIDGHFRSTFMQVRVALNLSHLAFESCFALRVLRDPWRPWRVLRPDEQPNKRMRWLLDDMAGGGFAALAESVHAWAGEFFAQENIEPWCLDDEAGWERDAVVANRLETQLDERMEAWLRRRTRWPVISQDKRRKCVHLLAQWGRQLGITVTSVPASAMKPRGADDALEHFLLDEATRVHVHRQAGSSIATHPLPVQFGRVDADALASSPEHRLAEHLLVVGADPGLDSDTWFVVRTGPAGARTNVRLHERAGHAVRASGGDVVSWLNRRARGPERGLPPVDIIIPFGIQWADGANGADSADIDLHYDERVVQYMTGNWIDFVQLAARLGDVVLTELQVDVKGYGDNAQPFTVKIAKTGAVRGRCCMRILTQHAASLVSLMELEWRANPAIRSVSSDEAEAEGIDLDLVASAVSGILAFWSRL